jgi:hypothetical protein
VLTCPFCGAPETDRLDLEGSRILVFRCLFSPTVDPALDEEALQAELKEHYAAGGGAYFRGMCDRLHLYVTKGEGARALLAPPTETPP